LTLKNVMIIHYIINIQKIKIAISSDLENDSNEYDNIDYSIEDL
jgi:SMC interacting uncharacterized protein involved in chromosome segregation